MQKQKGFSLIEIMVVLVIMGMQATLVLPNVMRALSSGYEQTVRSNLKNIESSLKMYKLDNFRYPTSDQGLEALVNKPEIEPIPRNWSRPYMDKLPLDPWQTPYIYLSPGESGKSYDIYTLGSDGVRGGDGEAADRSVWD